MVISKKTVKRIKRIKEMQAARVFREEPRPKTPSPIFLLGRVGEGGGRGLYVGGGELGSFTVQRLLLLV